MEAPKDSLAKHWLSGAARLLSSIARWMAVAVSSRRRVWVLGPAQVGPTVEQLAIVCSNKSVGFTTVAQIRIMGYEVVRTSGEAHHATVVVPEDWDRRRRGGTRRLVPARDQSSPRGDGSHEDHLCRLQREDRIGSLR